MRPDRFRVAALNLWQRYGDWPARRQVLIDGFRASKPDVVGFAESIKTDEYDQVADLFGPEFNSVHSKTRDSNGMGISIASHWPIRQVQEVNLNLTPRTAGFPCTTLVAQIIAPEPLGPFLFVNHFPNFQLNMEYERELQAIAVAREIEERVAENKEQVVMVGDMDADPEAASMRFWRGRQSLGGMSVCYRDAWESVHSNEPGPTFTPDNPLVRQQVVKGTRPFRDWPFKRIDYVLVRFGSHGGNAFDIVNCERIFAEASNGIWASDHFGLIADLQKAEAA